MQPNFTTTIRDTLLALVTSSPTAYAAGQWTSLSQCAHEVLLIAAQLEEAGLWHGGWHDEFLRGFTQGMR